MNVINEQLTTQQLLAAVEESPTQEQPKAGMSAIAAIKAAKSNVVALSNFAERLLKYVLPQVFQFLTEAYLLRDESPDIFQQPSDIEGQTWEMVVERIENALKHKANDDVPVITRAYHLARVRYWLYPKPSDETQSLIIWNNLCKEGYLCPMENGPVIFGSQCYGVDSKKFSFEQCDVNEITRLSQEICEKVLSAIAARNKPEEKQVKPAPIILQKVSALDVWHNRVYGTFELFFSSNGHGSVRKLFMESQPSGKNGPVLVITDSEGFSEIRSGESIPLSAIQNDDGSMRDGLKITVSSLPSDADKRCRVAYFGDVLKQGFSSALKATGRLEQEITPVYFLLGGVGQADITYPGTFEWRPNGNMAENIDFSNLTLRFARNAKHQIALTKVISGGYKAKEIFGKYIGEFLDTDDRFQNLEPLACGVFLRACYGKLVLETSSR
jgi:hypothetical protein